MADTVPITAGSGTVIGTDEVTIGGTAQHLQRMKLADGTDGGTDLIPGTAARGLSVDPRLKVVRLAVTPTISNGAIYAAKDAVGGIMTFANAARSSGASIRIEAVQVVDKGQQMAALDLILFDRNPGSGTFTDNSPSDPTDGEMATVIAVIPIGGYADLNDNSVADVPVGRAAVLNGTDLYGVLVARATPTYTSTGDLVVTITILQD